MGDEVIDGWCDERTPEQWRQWWSDHFDELGDGPHRYLLALRSYPEEFEAGAVSPGSWGAENPALDWDELVRTLELACTSWERRFLMNDAMWAVEFIFPRWRADGVDEVHTERLAWLLGYGVGDHEFRGDMMWNLTVHEEWLDPDEVDVTQGDLAEFVRRFPTDGQWAAACREATECVGDYGKFAALPAVMQCAVGALAYRSAAFGGSKWARTIARHRKSPGFAG